MAACGAVLAGDSMPAQAVTATGKPFIHMGCLENPSNQATSLYQQRTHHTSLPAAKTVGLGGPTDAGGCIMETMCLAIPTHSFTRLTEGLLSAQYMVLLVSTGHRVSSHT